MAEQWWCWCGGEQAADGHCENDLWHVVEPVILPALAEAVARKLDTGAFLGDDKETT